MMQPCASAARLLEGGPILSLGVDAMGGGGSPPTRIVLAFASRRRSAEPVKPLYGACMGLLLSSFNLAMSFPFHLLSLSIERLSMGRRRSTAMSQAVPARRQTPALTRRSEASLPVVATSRATTLYSVDRRRQKSSRIRTMMQSCASAARLLEGGAHSLPRR